MSYLRDVKCKTMGILPVHIPPHGVQAHGHQNLKHQGKIKEMGRGDNMTQVSLINEGHPPDSPLQMIGRLPPHLEI